MEQSNYFSAFSTFVVSLLLCWRLQSQSHQCLTFRAVELLSALNVKADSDRWPPSARSLNLQGDEDVASTPPVYLQCTSTTIQSHPLISTPHFILWRIWNCKHLPTDFEVFDTVYIFETMTNMWILSNVYLFNSVAFNYLRCCCCSFCYTILLLTPRCQPNLSQPITFSNPSAHIKQFVRGNSTLT